MVTEIGKVAVKVIPDTDGFRQKARAKLEEVEKSLSDLKVKMEVGKDKLATEANAAVKSAEKKVKRLNIRLDLDDSEEIRRAIKQVDEAYKDLGRTNKSYKKNVKGLEKAYGDLFSALDKVGDHKVIKVDLDTKEGAKKALAEVEAELQKLRLEDLRIDLDEDSLTAMKHELQKTIAGHEGLELDFDNKAYARLRKRMEVLFNGISIRPDISPEDARKLTHRIEEAVEREAEIKTDLYDVRVPDRVKAKLRRELEDIEAQIEVDIQELSFRKAQSRLAWLAHTRFAEIVPRVNQAAAAKAAASLAALSGGRAVGNIVQDLGEWIGELDKSIPKVGALTLGITNLGASLLATTSNILSFSGSLASIAGASLALPGIFGGMAIGAGASIAVLKDFNKILPEVGDNLKDLQNSMSSNFWAKAKGPFQEFFASILPQFSRNIERTSTDLGGFFANLADSAKNVFNGELKQMFDDLNTSIETMGKHTDSIIGIIEKLGSVGAGMLPRLAGWFGNVFDEFDGWLAKNQKNGQLQRWVDEGVEALQDLGTALRYTGSMFAGLAKAAEAAGGSTLKTFATTMKAVAKTVNGTTFQDNFSGVLEAAHKAMANISSGAGKSFESFMVRLSHTLQNVLPQAGETLGTALGAIFDALDQTKVQRSAEGFFKNLGSAVEAMAPALPGVARGLAGIVDVLGKVTVTVGKAIGASFGDLGDSVAQLSKDLDPLIDVLGNILVNAASGAGDVLKTLAPVLGSVAKSVAILLKPIEMLTNAFSKLPGPVQTVLSTLATLGITVGAAGWMGGAVASKMDVFSQKLLYLGQTAPIVGRQISSVGTQVGLMSTRMGRFTGIASLTAGLGAMAVAGNTSNKAISTLANTGGAALMGFAVGGPIGAAIGGGVGLVASLGSALLDSGDSAQEAALKMEKYRAKLQELQGTLDTTTGAITEMTNARVYDNLQAEGMLKVADNLGISERTLVRGVAGHTKARMRLNQALAAFNPLANAANFFSSTQVEKLKEEINFTDEAVGKYRERIKATKEWGTILKGLPPEVKSYIKVSLPRNKKDLANMATTLDNMSNKQIKMVMDILGIDGTVKDVRRLQENLEKVPPRNSAARMSGWGRDVSKHVRKAERDTANGVKGVNKHLKTAGNVDPKIESWKKVLAKGVSGGEKDTAKGEKAMNKNLKNVGNVKINSGPFVGSIHGAISAGRSAAAGASSIGGAIVGGVTGGVNAAAGSLASAAVRAVRNALAAAKRALNINSPSRVFRDQVGKPMAQGMAVGLNRNAKLVTTAIQRLVRISFEDFGKIVGKVTGQVNRMVKKALKAVKRNKSVRGSNKQLKHMSKLLKHVNRQHTQMVSAIKKQQQALSQLRQEANAYRKQIVDAVTATGDPTRVGGETWHAVQAGYEIAYKEAEKFADAITQLQNKGLNRDTISQLIAAGPEAALGEALAILDKGSAGIKLVNWYQKQINKAAGKIGNVGYEAMYADQIAKATANLNRMVRRLKPLQRRLERLSNRMFKAMLREAKDKVPRINRHLRKLARQLNRVSKQYRNLPKSVNNGVGWNYDTKAPSSTVTYKTINYYAASGSSTTEEDLFAAAQRARMAF